ncbi:hypothetical protein BCF88_1191, partial [Metamycoplasma alkalescens]
LKDLASKSSSKISPSPADPLPGSHNGAGFDEWILGY